MAKVREQIEAEFENIERTITDIPNTELLSNLSRLELAGLASLIHNFYNGVENILKKIVTSSGKKLPEGPSWHQDLINIAVSNKILCESTGRKLRQYLAFRHFFSHSYSFELDPKQMLNLVKDIRAIYDCFKDEIKKAIDGI